jgi:hypothetical protein
MNPPFTPAYKFAMWLVPIGFFLNFLEFHGNGQLSCKDCGDIGKFFSYLMETLFLTAFDAITAIIYFILKLSNNIQSWPNFYQMYLMIHRNGNSIYFGTILILIAIIIGQVVPERQSS